MKKAILDLSEVLYRSDGYSLPKAAEDELLTAEEILRLTREYSAEMHKAADDMEFERAAELRDKVLLLKDMDLGLKPPSRSLLETGAQREERPQPRRRAAGRGRKRR